MHENYVSMEVDYAIIFIFLLSVTADAKSWRKQEIPSDSSVMSPPPPAPVSLTFTRLSPAAGGIQNCTPTPMVGSGKYFLC